MGDAIKTLPDGTGVIQQGIAKVTDGDRYRLLGLRAEVGHYIVEWLHQNGYPAVVLSIDVSEDKDVQRMRATLDPHLVPGVKGPGEKWVKALEAASRLYEVAAIQGSRGMRVRRALDKFVRAWDDMLE